MSKPIHLAPDGGENLEELGWQLQEDISFPALGPLWHLNVGTEHCYALTLTKRLLNRFGILHGGVTAALLDAALGRACRHDKPDQIQSTIELSIQYISAARLGERVLVVGRLAHGARSIAFSQGEMFCGDRLVAKAQGVYKIHSHRQ